MLSIPVWLLLQTFHLTFGQTGNLQAAKRLSKLSTDCYLALFPLTCTMHDIVPDHRKWERELHQTETVKKLQKLALPGTVRSLGVMAEISHCSCNIAKDAGKIACELTETSKRHAAYNLSQQVNRALASRAGSQDAAVRDQTAGLRIWLASQQLITPGRRSSVDYNKYAGARDDAALRSPPKIITLWQCD